jgi:hypothetical protein
VIKIGNYLRFSTTIDIGFLKSGLNDENFTQIIRDLVATIIRVEGVMKMNINRISIDYGNTERHN